jgi:hypothetical protein
LDGGPARRKAATYTEDNKKELNAHTDIHALSGIRTHDPNVRASEDSSCLRPRDHRSRPTLILIHEFPVVLPFGTAPQAHTPVINSAVKRTVHKICFRIQGVPILDTEERRDLGFRIYLMTLNDTVQLY